MTDTQAIRPPQENIPRTRQMRNKLRDLSKDYAQSHRLTEPLSIEDLRIHAVAMLEQAGIDSRYSDFSAILINNAIWQDTVAGTPFNKRLLLLPRCLRHATNCPAECDDIGLLCEHCGRCVIDAFKTQAENLGYAVLIAEGSPVVMSLIETGQIEAVVGVSCLSTLERVYPYMEAGAVPGVAIPLLMDGCHNTRVDTDWIWEALFDSRDTQAHRLDMQAQREQVDAWFTPDAITHLIEPGTDHVAQIGCNWLARAGKRWRPFLTACTAEALKDQQSFDMADLQTVAVAVECFHKASLIHDDIEDHDTERYGEPTLHCEHTMPIALNAGDYLVGLGYHLLVHNALAPEQQAALIRIASQGHKTLCLGQGAELDWSQVPRILSVTEVLEIFRQKTAPAFEVALLCGTVMTNQHVTLEPALHQYSEALGIAYQIHDDLEDLLQGSEACSRIITRPSILTALAYDQASESDKAVLTQATLGQVTVEQVLPILSRLRIETQAAHLMETYKSQAIAALSQLHSAPLKGLLRRMISKIFLDFDIMGCCNDPQTGHDQGRD